jgi:VanZ family protein
MTETKPKHPFLMYQLPALLWALVIVVGTSIPGEDIPDLPIFSEDKLIHFGLYLLLASLSYRAFHRQMRFPALQKSPGISTIVVIGVFALLDELHQLFVPGRSCDPFDWMADVLGACVLVLIIAGVHWLSRRRTGPPAAN